MTVASSQARWPPTRNTSRWRRCCPISGSAASAGRAAPPGRYKEQLAFLERAHREGAWMYAQTASNPPSPVFELAEYNGFDAMPGWIDPFVGTPEERIAKLKKPGVRER